MISLIACDSALPPEPQAQSRATSEVEASAGTLASTLASTSTVATTSRVGANAIPAAAQCPPPYFITGINLAKNPSFELGTGPKTWPPGPTPVASAAKGWFMHSSNSQATVTSMRVPTNVPGPGGSMMLRFQAGGNEGGVYQQISNAGARVMFSVWVRVVTGHVIIGANSMVNLTPYSWSTKKNEWEQLRVCTDGTYPTDMFFIENEDPSGGLFYVDRAEIMQIP